MAVITTVLFLFLSFAKTIRLWLHVRGDSKSKHNLCVDQIYEKMFNYVPPVLLYNVESKVHGNNFIRHFLALISMFS